MGLGEQTSVAEVVRRVERYRGVFSRTGGGLTISGGEPLLQPRFVAAIFRECAALGVHTALDTSGALGQQASDGLLEDTSLVLLDIKAFSQHTYERVTQGGSLAPTLRFAERLEAMRVPVWIRFVVVPGVNDGEKNVGELAAYVAGLANVERVDVIGFHRLGEPKYAALGIPFPLASTPSPTGEQLEAVRHRFAANGLTVT